jgi:putative DNA primase/helicase
VISHSEIVSRLDATQNGHGHKAKCPAHEDSKPSLSIKVGDDGRILLNCFAGCTVEAIADALGVKVADLYPEQTKAKRAITVADLATDKRLPATHLRDLGLRDLGDGGVGIPYRDAQGTEIAIKRRTALVAKDGSWWQKGVPLMAYGQERLEDARQAGYLLIVEGESDCWAGWHHDVPVLGVPGANNAKVVTGEQLAGIGQLYIVKEPGKGGEAFAKGVTERLASIRFKGAAQVIAFDDAKDLAELHAKHGDQLPAKLAEAIEQTVPKAGPPLAVCAADIQIRPVRWLWKGRIASGMMNILDGWPGQGKSTVTTDIAKRVTRGEALPGDAHANPPGAVVFVSFEEAAAEVIVPRLTAAGADLSRVHIWNLAEHGFNLSDSLDGLRGLIQRVGAVLVVVDPFMAALPGDANAHKDQDVRRVLAPVASLAETTGAAILFVRHLTKADGGSAVTRGGGSIGIIGACRVGMLLGPDGDDDECRVLAVSKCNVGRMAPALKLRLVEADAPAPGIEVARVKWEGTCTTSADDMVSAQEDRGVKAQAITMLRELLRDGPVSAKDGEDACKAHGINPRTVDRARRDVGVEAFKVGKMWMWRLPEKEGRQ